GHAVDRSIPFSWHVLAVELLILGLVVLGILFLPDGRVSGQSRTAGASYFHPSGSAGTAIDTTKCSGESAHLGSAGAASGGSQAGRSCSDFQSSGPRVR